MFNAKPNRTDFKFAIPQASNSDITYNRIEGERTLFDQEMAFFRTIQISN